MLFANNTSTLFNRQVLFDYRTGASFFTDSSRGSGFLGGPSHDLRGPEHRAGLVPPVPVPEQRAAGARPASGLLSRYALRFLLTPRIRLVFNWPHSAVALLHEMFLVTYLYHPSCINVLAMKSFSQRILMSES